jgi:hypothetical protein
MRAKQQKHLVNQCATLAAAAPRVQAYVILYEEGDGSISYHRNGSVFSQLGMVKVAEQLMAGAFGDIQKDEED